MELIVDKKELTPSRKKQQQKIEDETVVPVRIEYGEKQLGKMARSAGGKWNPDVKLWYIRYGKIKGTELEKHIILDAGMKKDNKVFKASYCITIPAYNIR